MKLLIIAFALAACLCAVEATGILAAAIIVKAAIIKGGAIGIGKAYLVNRARGGRGWGGSRYGRETNVYYRNPGYGIAGYRIGKRSVEDESDISEMLLLASRSDADDCAKKMICMLNAADAKTLAEEELAIAKAFGQNESIDVAAVTVEFDLAAIMGKKVGPSQCEIIYSRCPYQIKEIMEALQQPMGSLNQI